MASKSYGLNFGTVDVGPENITVGTLAVSTNDVELRVDLTKVTKTQDLIELVEAFVRRIESNNGAGDFGVV